jgi:hypothetical protein
MCVGVTQLHGFASSPAVSDIATVAPRDVARCSRRTTDDERGMESVRCLVTVVAFSILLLAA